jgi:hypothetical protein
MEVSSPELKTIEVWLTHLVEMAHKEDYGPLSLQVGSITGAVDDLVHGYEQLVHSLPNLTNQITNVHADTEQMAKQLEVPPSLSLFALQRSCFNSDLC